MMMLHFVLYVRPRRGGEFARGDEQCEGGESEAAKGGVARKVFSSGHAGTMARCGAVGQSKMRCLLRVSRAVGRGGGGGRG